MAILTNVSESSLNDYNRDYVESKIENYTNEAKKEIRDLLLSCCYIIEHIESSFITLDEYDFYGNLVSSIDILATDKEF